MGPLKKIIRQFHYIEYRSKPSFIKLTHVYAEV